MISGYWPTHYYAQHYWYERYWFGVVETAEEIIELVHKYFTVLVEIEVREDVSH